MAVLHRSYMLTSTLFKIRLKKTGEKPWYVKFFLARLVIQNDAVLLDHAVTTAQFLRRSASRKVEYARLRMRMFLGWRNLNKLVVHDSTQSLFQQTGVEESLSSYWLPKDLCAQC